MAVSGCVRLHPAVSGCVRLCPAVDGWLGFLEIMVASYSNCVRSAAKYLCHPGAPKKCRNPKLKTYLSFPLKTSVCKKNCRLASAAVSAISIVDTGSTERSQVVNHGGHKTKITQVGLICSPFM